MKMLPVTKVDKMNLINISCVFVIGISYTLGAIGIVLLTNLTKISIALILFTVFEWINAGLSTVTFLYLTINDKINQKVVNIMRLTFTIFIIASTVVGIYWIDDIILENVTEQQIYIRQLKVSFTTLFIISMLFKSSFFIQLLSTNEGEYQYSDDIEANHNFETNSEPTTTDSLLSNKHSLQTLISQKSGNTAKKNNEKVTPCTHAGLNIKFVERFPNTKGPESITDTSDNTTPEIINNQDHPTPIYNNATYIESPILPVLPVLSNRITEEDVESWNSSRNEDRAIQMLNICEPLFPGDTAESAPQRLQRPRGCTDDPDTHSTLYETLNREIRQNRSRHSLHIQQSLPNLRQDTCRSSVHLQRGGRGSVTKVLRGSFSTSNLSANNNNHNGYNSNSISERNTLNSIATTFDCNNRLGSLESNHQKSISLSELSLSKRSGSRSLSPLKKLKNFKESIQLTPNASKPSSNQSPHGNGNNDEFELDLNLANSIRSNSPQKKSSSKSLNSRRVSLVTSPARNNFSTSISVQDLSTSSPIKYDDELALESDHDDDIDLDIVEDYYSSSRIKKQLTFNIDDFKNINNIINIQKRTTSGHSNTDRSTLSNNSVPSGYYGEYDKEKWRVYKKFQHGSIYQE